MWNNYDDFSSSSSGMDLLGFLPGSNFLLPWDIAVKSEQEKWPTVTETFGAAKKRQMRKLAKGKIFSSVIMAFIQMFQLKEYKCNSFDAHCTNICFCLIFFYFFVCWYTRCVLKKFDEWSDISAAMWSRW